MAEEDGLLALQGLHSDLLAFSENRLQDIERLVNELDSRVEEFRSLLDKKGKADASRKRLNEGTYCVCALRPALHNGLESHEASKPFYRALGRCSRLEDSQSIASDPEAMQ
jgi:hypothetical protein